MVYYEIEATPAAYVNDGNGLTDPAPANSLLRIAVA
jgi:hypothetical protein